MYVLIKPPASGGGDDDDDVSPVTATTTASDAAAPSTSRVDSDGGCTGTTTFEDNDLSVDDDDDDDAFNMIVSRYMSKRNININDVRDRKCTSKAVIEYVNFKYIENNFRTIGLNEQFDKNNISEAQKEFESFEKWFIRKKKYIHGKTYIRDLRLPMFSHLYLNLYSENNRERLLAFLDTFKYLFVKSKGIAFLEELKNVSDINNLSPYLSLFRKNKYVFYVSPEFLTNLYEFFHHHYMLKVVFQEWFDINYSTNEDPMTIFKNYYSKHKSKPNNQAKAKGTNSSNNKLNTDSSSVSNNNMNMKKLNLSENKDNQQTNDSQNNPSEISTMILEDHLTESELIFLNITNNKETKMKQQKKPKKINGENRSNHSNSSSNSSSEDLNSTLSFSDEEIVERKYVRNKEKSGEPLSYKNSYHMKVLYNTKIQVKNLEEDSYLNTTRQISLTNCKKISCTLLTTDLKNVAAGSLDSLIYLWERTKFDINNLLNSPSDKSNNFIEYYDKSSAIILRGHGGSIFDLAEIPSAKLLLSGSNDKTFRAWDLESKRCLEIYDEYEHRTWCIAACPHSLQVATGSCDGTSCLWFLNYKRPLRVFVGHLDDILVIKFHPNQVLLATGSADKTIRVFELTTGECQRLLLGHSDYISCLEFHTEKPNILASACGAGEVILWDLPSGEIVWKLKVTQALFSDLAWLTSDVLLASINTGVILKCDTKKNYINTVEKVDGLTTRLNRLMSLKIVDNITYAVGIAGKAVVPKSSSARRQPTITNLQTSQQHQHGEQRAPSQQQPNTENNNGGGGGGPVTANLAAYDFQYQLNPNSTTTQASPEFLQMNLQCSPFNLTSDETTKLSAEYQSNNIKLVQKGSKKPTASTRNDKKCVHVTGGPPSTSQTNVPPSNVQSTNNNTNVPVQHRLDNNSQPETNPTILSNRKGNNIVVQQQQQQSPRLEPQQVQQTKRRRLTAAQKAGAQKQEPILNPIQQPGAPSASKKTNVQPRQPRQHKRKPQQQPPNTAVGDKKLSKTNVARLSSDLTTERMSIAAAPPLSSTGGVRFAVWPLPSSQKPASAAAAAKQASLEKLPPEEYARLRQAVMASLLKTNPEMFARGQTVIGEITRSQPSVDDSQTGQPPPQNDENPQKN